MGDYILYGIVIYLLGVIITLVRELYLEDHRSLLDPAPSRATVARRVFGWPIVVLVALALLFLRPCEK